MRTAIFFGFVILAASINRTFIDGSRLGLLIFALVCVYYDYLEMKYKKENANSKIKE